jgi:membrane-associated protein
VTPTLDAVFLTPMLLPTWMDPEYILNHFGPAALWVVAFIIFAECGLFAILPGDSLLFTVGLFVGAGAIDHSMVVVCLVLTIAAIAGNVCGYWIGRLIGPPLFKPREGLIGRILNPKYVAKTHDFFERHGNRALILARFVPIVRTFVTLVAGVSRMHFGRFITYTAIGGVLWACGITILGRLVGNVSFVRDNLDAMLVLIVALSLIPMAVEFLRHRRTARQPGSPSR